MRVLESALALCDEIGEELHVLWLMNRDLNCRFDVLFRIPPGVASVRHLSTMSLPGAVLGRLVGHALGAACQVRLDDGTHARLAREGTTLQRLVAGKRTLIVGCKSFHGPMTGFGRFVPVDALRDIVDATVDSSEGLVGVHIRRRDGEWPTRYSPTSAFVDMMEREVREDPDTVFFVASDDEREPALLRQRFPGRIRSHRKQDHGRTRPEGIQDALVDLYCLARCRKLIGSFGSSFSDVAALLGGTPIDRPRVLPSAWEEFSGKLAPPDLTSDESLFQAVRRVRWARGIFCPACGGDQWVPLDPTRPEAPRRYGCRPCARSFDDLAGSVFVEHRADLRPCLECLVELDRGVPADEIARGRGVPLDHVYRLIAQLRAVPGA